MKFFVINNFLKLKSLWHKTIKTLHNTNGIFNNINEIFYNPNRSFTIYKWKSIQHKKIVYNANRKLYNANIKYKCKLYDNNR